MKDRKTGIVIHEVGLRDGLQMESRTVPTEGKLRWLRPLMESGVDIVQVGSFVHPAKVPQMADTDSLFAELAAAGKPPHVTLSGLVLNEKGLERGLACGVELFCMGVSASETHSRKNTGMGVAEATERIVAMAHQALSAGRRVQLSVQSAFGCGYEGVVPQERVLSIVRRYCEEGLRNISLADTAGHAVPDQVERMYEDLALIDEDVETACHFHNTYGLALANVYAALKSGVRSFESSVAGLGGCPFTTIAGGNVCTEDMVHMFRAMRLREDVKLDAIISVAADMANFFERELPGMVYRTGKRADAHDRELSVR
jgi:hydroxymethylglutaryl-CoA lyase